MKLINKAQLFTAATVLAASAVLAPAAEAALSGNIGVVSKYVFRGNTNNAESDVPAVQGGLDYATDSGVYAGYWGSNLDYGDNPPNSGFENDLYVGYSGTAGPISYDVSALQYVYVGVSDADALELNGSIGYGPVTLGLVYVTNDVNWESSGDMYWTLGYETDLPASFSFAAKAGYFTWDDGTNDKATYTTTKTSGLGHVDLTLSHPVANTGADMSVTYIVGGKDRTDTDLEDTMVLGLSYNFDI